MDSLPLQPHASYTILSHAASREAPSGMVCPLALCSADADTAAYRKRKPGPDHTSPTRLLSRSSTSRKVSHGMHRTLLSYQLWQTPLPIHPRRDMGRSLASRLC